MFDPADPKNLWVEEQGSASVSRRAGPSTNTRWNERQENREGQGRLIPMREKREGRKRMSRDTGEGREVLWG